MHYLSEIFYDFGVFYTRINLSIVYPPSATDAISENRYPGRIYAGIGVSYLHP